MWRYRTMTSRQIINLNCHWLSVFIFITAILSITCNPLSEIQLPKEIVFNDNKTNISSDVGSYENATLFYRDNDLSKQLDKSNDNQTNNIHRYEEEKSWLSYWNSRKQEYTLSMILETVFDAFTGGLSNIVSNVLGNDSKNSRVVANRVNYKGHQLLRVYSVANEQRDELQEMRESDSNEIKFWTESYDNKSIDIIAAPDVINDVKDYLRDRNMEFEILLTDLQKVIANQNPKMSKEQRDDLMTNQGHSMTWKRYHRLGDIMKYLDYLASTYPSLVKLETIGRSYEGQPLKVVKISSGKKKSGATKPTVWIDAGIHAREWISIAVATYILSQLVEKNTSYTKLLDKTDWMIMPVANPDGYEFTHTGDRLWRKTRSNHEDNTEARYTPSGFFHLVAHYTKWFWERCEGVDPNRNFDYYWGEDKIRSDSVSADPCHETYEGPRAFSEPETKAMADYIMSHREDIKLYLTLHSYNQMWLVPWGHTHKKPSDYAELVNVANKAARAIEKVYGTTYRVGCSSDLLYPTTGASDDWAKGVAGIKYSYTLELRDRGTYGFLLPASQIIPTARETWAGVRAIARLVANAS
ncbi:hypothetical protein PV325_006862 [Microctonus aethiopoides]|nr:hypothetical protein PV325_006862 [Microctonus aethiopoides]